MKSGEYQTFTVAVGCIRFKYQDSRQKNLMSNLLRISPVFRDVTLCNIHLPYPKVSETNRRAFETSQYFLATEHNIPGKQNLQ
jgi:hypothetical protein